MGGEETLNHRPKNVTVGISFVSTLAMDVPHNRLRTAIYDLMDCLADERLCLELVLHKYNMVHETASEITRGRIAGVVSPNQIVRASHRSHEDFVSAIVSNLYWIGKAVVDS